MKFEGWERKKRTLKFLVAAGVVALTPGLGKTQTVDHQTPKGGTSLDVGKGTYQEPHKYRLPGGEDPMVAQLNRQTPESIKKAKQEMEATIKVKRAKQRARISNSEELKKFDHETEALLLAIRTGITDPSVVTREEEEANEQ